MRQRRWEETAVIYLTEKPTGNFFGRGRLPRNCGRLCSMAARVLRLFISLYLPKIKKYLMEQKL
jgi:FOG: EAL domain